MPLLPPIRFMSSLINVRNLLTLFVILTVVMVIEWIKAPECKSCAGDFSCPPEDGEIWKILEQNMDNELSFSVKMSSYLCFLPSLQDIVQARFWPHDKSAVEWVSRNLHAPASDSTPYKLTHPDYDDFSQFHQTPLVFKEYLGKKRNGRFFEIGAFDGERFSNTLSLEKDYNWTGILVEADPVNYQMIRLKKRKAHTLRACLLNVWKPTNKVFSFFGPLGGLFDAKSTINPHAKPQNVMCVPMSAVLHALNWTRIDYFSLDTEGSEPEILMSIPWNYVDIDVVQIECNKCQHPLDRSPDYVRKRGFLGTFMDVVGYDEVDFIQLDFVYKKRRPKK